MPWTCPACHRQIIHTELEAKPRLGTASRFTPIPFVASRTHVGLAYVLPVTSTTIAISTNATATIPALSSHVISGMMFIGRSLLLVGQAVGQLGQCPDNCLQIPHYLRGVACLG